MSYAEELFDLTGQVVLITGGSRGLGREMAFGVARCGADVVIASRKMENCVSVAEQIESATGRTAMPYQVHVGRWDQLDGLVDAVDAPRVYRNTGRGSPGVFASPISLLKPGVKIDHLSGIGDDWIFQRLYDLDGDVWDRWTNDPTDTMRDSWRMQDYDPDNQDSAAAGVYVTPHLLTRYGPLTHLDISWQGGPRPEDDPVPGR